MRRWRPALLGTLLCAALLTGCSQSNGLLKEETDLLEAPLRLQQQEQLLDAVYTYLGGVTLKYPMGSDSASPFLTWDADGDGREELLVTYQNAAKSKNVQLAVLRQAADDGWYAAHMDIEGAAGELDGLHTVRLADGSDCLLVGYQEPAGQDWTVCLYQWQNGALREQTRLQCQQYVLYDFNGDGYLQLAMVQRNETHGMLQLRTFTFADGQTEELLQEKSVTTLDSRFEHCTWLSAEELSAAEKALVMDFSDGDGNSLGEVMSYALGRFVRCYTQDAVNIPNFTARPFDGLRPMDVDGDGVTELPRMEARALGSLTNTRRYLVSWYAIGAQSQQLRACSVVNMAAGYLTLVPVEWNGLVSLQEEGGGIWSIRDMATGSRMAQYQLTAGHASAEYQLIGDTGQKRLYLQCADTLSAQERTTLAEGFRLLYL